MKQEKRSPGVSKLQLQRVQEAVERLSDRVERGTASQRQIVHELCEIYDWLNRLQYIAEE